MPWSETWSWQPQDPFGEGHAALRQYLEETMGPERGSRWLKELDELLDRCALNREDVNLLVRGICREDAPELVELLYPIAAELFLTPWEQDDGQGRRFRPDSPPEERSRLAGGRLPPLKRLSRWGARLNALALCALMGRAGCLEALLELGADPNGLDMGEEWNLLAFTDDPLAAPMPVTPLDCALAAGEEDCALLLELYGGQTARELCGLGDGQLPLLYRQAVPDE